MEILDRPTLQADELERRLSMWREVTKAAGPKGVRPEVYANLSIYQPGRGIWRDKKNLSELAPEGVTVGVLHTGRHYDDELSEGGMLYHYPSTKVKGSDEGDIEATKSAKRLGLPIFVVIGSDRHRDVRMGWVEDWDDELGAFYVSFGEEPLTPEPEVADEDFDPTKPQGSRGRKKGQTEQRPDQPQFKMKVNKRYGISCAMCGLAVEKLLVAAHLVPWSKTYCNDARNGLNLCQNHHKALDDGLVLINPKTMLFQSSETGPDLETLLVTLPSIEHLPNQPSLRALDWLWKEKRTEIPA